MRLLFIRHAEPDYDNDTLTNEGFLEAKALADAYSDFQFDEAYSSPFARALLTAQAFMEKHQGKELIVYPWLREFCHPIETKNGPMGCPWDFLPSFIQESPGLLMGKRYLDEPSLSSGSIKEHYKNATWQFDAWMKQAGYTRKGLYYQVDQGNEKTFVFFCHFGISCVFLSHLLNIPFTALTQGFMCLPSGVTTLVSEEREKGLAGFRLLRFGDTSHLDKAGLHPSFAGRFCEIFDSPDRH